VLQILAAQASVFDGLIIPMIDARRMEVYSAIFTPELKNKRNVLKLLLKIHLKS
jgi:tRNA threonylcarbamoyladenosine biosynthesis protein TsaB